MVDTADHWNRYLRKVQYVINNTYHSVVQASPSKLMLGFEQRNNKDRDLSSFVQALDKIDADLDQERSQHRDLALTATNKIKEYNKSYYDAKHKTPTAYNKRFCVD